MRTLSRLLLFLLAGAAGSVKAQTPAAPATPGDEIHSIQVRPLRQAHRLELSTFGQVGIADPYLQRFGAGLRGMYHVREGLSLGFEGSGMGTWETQESVMAKRDLQARLLQSRLRASAAGVVAIAPIYGKVALPGDLLAHFETFIDAGLGAGFTETDAGKGVRPLLLAGIGQRLFLGDRFALSARFGGQMYAERVRVNGTPTTKATGFYTVSLGLSFYFPGQHEEAR